MNRNIYIIICAINTIELYGAADLIARKQYKLNRKSSLMSSSQGWKQVGGNEELFEVSDDYKLVFSEDSQDISINGS